MSKRLIAVFLMCCLFLTACAGVKAADDNKAYSYKEYELIRNGINLHLDCMTKDEAEVRDNILLVHGLTYSSHEFDVDYKDYSFVRFLCDHGYAVWRLDIAGYGQSGNVEDGFMPDSEYASKDIEAAIDKILELTDADTIDLFGWSWGTVTSALAEEEYYEVIDDYVMYAPILSGIGEAEITEGFHENSPEHELSDFRLNEDGTVDNSFVEPDLIDTYWSNCEKYDGSHSPNGGRVDLCVDNSIKLIDLSKIKNPTLVICGDEDPYMNLPLVEDSINKLPDGSELRIIEGGAHAVIMEKPYYKEFREAVLDFLEKDN